MNRKDIEKSVVQLQRPLMSLAMSLTRCSVDSMDLYQETALKAMDKHYLFTNREGGSLKAWLSTIMRNIFINNYRKQKRRNVLDNSSSDGFILRSVSSTSNDGENTLLGQELIKVLNSISEDKRTPFILHYKGYSYEEIAQKMELPLGTVKSKIYYARKYMQREIKSRYGGRPQAIS